MMEERGLELDHTTGFSIMLQNSKNDSNGIRNVTLDAGTWTKPTSR